MNRYCSPMCRICRAPGPGLCVASARAEAEERHEEERDAIADAFYADSFADRPNRPEGSYFDPSDPWPVIHNGHLADDPALDFT